MRRALLALAATAAVIMATAVVAINTADLSSNYFAGRSGQILVAGQEQTPRDAHAVVLDSQRFFRGLSASSLQLTSLTHVLAGALGLQQPLGAAHPNDADQLVPANQAQAKRPNAQVIFNVESVGKATLDRFQLGALSNPATAHLTLPLSSPPVTPPASSLSIATSVSTGAPVSAHGIVGASWKNAKGQVVEAFDPAFQAESFPAVSNLADAVSAATHGKGLTLSVSGNPALAWAFAAKPALGSNNFCVSLQDGATVFRAAESNSAPALDFKIGSLEQQLSTSPNSVLTNLGSMQASLADHVVTLRYSASAKTTGAALQTARFDLRNKADALFIAELQYALDLPAKLKSVSSLNEALNDEAQDLIVVSFSGFTALVEQYGRESEQLKAALHLLNQLFPLLSSQYASLFSSEQPAALQTIVFLGSHPSVLEKADRRDVEAVLKADHISHLSFFPNLYLPANENVLATCKKLNKDLAAVKYVAYCPTVQTKPHVLVELHTADGVASPVGVPVSKRNRAAGDARPFTGPYVCGGDVPCPDDVQRYQIILWFSILISLVAIAAVYQLAFMSFKKDTMLYSSFNPNWEDRKRR